MEEKRVMTFLDDLIGAKKSTEEIDPDRRIRIKSPSGTYAITRDRDGEGDFGPVLRAIDRDGTFDQVGDNGEIVIGCAIQCGSAHARTMQAQDWWLTTTITEVLERAPDDSWVKVKTKNSVYTIRGL